MTYSIEFRQAVLNHKEKHGLSLRRTAKKFDIGVASLTRWLRCLEPCKTRRRKPSKITNEALLYDIKQYPDAYHHERAKRLKCSAMGICHALKRLNITRKKNTQTS